MFEKATRLALRFDSPKGLLSVEDLWHLPLQASTTRANLDDIARALHQKLRNDANVSFVEKDRKSDEMVQLKFDIVKHIIDTKLVELEAATKERAAAERRQRILAIIADREDDDLRKLPLDELRKAAE